MEYEIGKFYTIKCVELLNSNGKKFDVVPVIGEPHRDPQFGIDIKHYHVDGRFIPKNSYLPHEHGKTNNVVWCKDDRYHMNVYAGKEVFRRLKCKRLSTGIIPPKNSPKFQDWYNSFVGKSCKGKKCPHLGQEMIEENGVLVCPLHNLKGCIEKEVIISL